MNRIYLLLPFFVLTLTIVTCTSCGESPMSTSSYDANSTPSSTISLVTPSLTNTTALGPTKDLTASPESSSLPSCSIVNEEEKLYVLSNDVFYTWGPGEEELDHALAGHFADWAAFRQTFWIKGTPVVESTGRIMRVCSVSETSGLNSAVTLIALGLSLDWYLPPDGDLYSQALITGERLVRFLSEWINSENIRSRYPEVANAATYALYAFFDYDKEMLQVWYDTYYQLFQADPSQPPIKAFLQADTTTIEPFLSRPFLNPEDSFYYTTAFFDHQQPRYTGEDSSYQDNLYRFDGKVFENADLDHPCNSGVNCYSGHDGIDYNTPADRSILAAASGKVIYIDPNHQGTIIIQHDNGLATEYRHLNTIVVDENDEVEQGDRIGGGRCY